MILAGRLALQLLAGQIAAAGDPAPWLDSLERAEHLLASATGYTAVFHKTERIGKKLVVADTMRFKFMRPFSVYVEWLNPKGTGGEAIYVDGWNDNRVRVHPGGFWGIMNFNLKVTSRWLRKNNRHLITQAGLGNLTTVISTNVRRAISAGEFESVHHGPITFFGRSAIALEGIFPADPAKGYWCRRTLVFFECDSGLPLNIRNYDADDQLVEEYGYEHFTVAPAMTAADFDPANPNYRF